MFIHKETRKRINPYAPVEIDGVKHAKHPLDLLEEIPEPAAPADYSADIYYRTEQDDAPYVVFTKKSDEQLAHQADAKALDEAKRHLIDTDYLFTVDKHAQLVEPRLTELTTSREAARQVIRDYDIKYPKVAL